MSVMRFSECPCCGSKPDSRPGSARALSRWNARGILIFVLGCCVIALGALLRFAWDDKCGVYVSLSGQFVILTVLALRLPSRNHKESNKA